MNLYDWIQVAVYIGVLLLLRPLLGSYMVHVFEGDRRLLVFPLGWLERSVYKISGVDSKSEMTWRQYAWSVLVFNFIGFVVVFILQLFQSRLPFNPQNLQDVSWHGAFNTAASFMTNTNWQSYSGETTLSCLVQMLGLAVQNFLSAATGICVFLALVRGILGRTGNVLGNFWVDMTRSIIYILLPLSAVLAVFLMSQGVVQGFSHYIVAHTLEGARQVIPMGPAASQIAIKQLGTNGGGFFGANSAHPFENPTPLSNWLEMLSILLIPMALTYSYGAMVKSKKHGWIVFMAMFLVWIGGMALALHGEYMANQVLGTRALMEGKEVRFGVANSILWSVSTTAASSGSVNAMLSSLSPLAGGVALFNIMLGEIIFGGVGSGLYGMLMFVLMTVFLAGLMVGRTPEYLGKKIGTKEIGMVLITILAPSAAILVGSSIAAVLPSALSSLSIGGPHGLSEILYAFSSASQNNGSAFAGLNANTPFYNILLGVCMLIGRFAVIIPVLAIAGSLVKKNISPPSEGTFSTDNVVFLVLLIFVILIVGALTFFPALSLGPIIEHFLMMAGRAF